MASRNRVDLIGNLGADPEVRYMPNGDAVANLRIATTEKYKDHATGENKERTEWHRVVMYRQLAELANKYLSKGSSILIEGKLRTRKWSKDGQDHYTTEVEATEMQFIGSPRNGSQTASGADKGSAAPSKRQQSDSAEDSFGDAPF